ncbi:hypothetical protein DK150_400013 [Flavobacterium psychrophilum]|nr:hypothetical protein DK150_400013 [Flavobacterium psychrophilum]
MYCTYLHSNLSQAIWTLNHSTQEVYSGISRKIQANSWLLFKRLSVDKNISFFSIGTSNIQP